MWNTSFSHNVDPLGNICSLSLDTSIIELLGKELKSRVTQKAISNTDHFLTGKTALQELCVRDTRKNTYLGRSPRTGSMDLPCN